MVGREDQQKPEQQFEHLREDLRRDASDFPLSDLRPVLIPSPILATGKWVGPFHYFSHLPVSLTWAYLRPGQTMIYLAHDTVASLEARGVDWRAAARDALNRDFQARPWSHEFRNESGTAEGFALMHEDGLGPSRLLCTRGLLRNFPEGFQFFVPERSCAFVLRRTASAAVRASLEQVVTKCFERADVPMSTSGFRHQELVAALDSIGEGDS